MVGQIEALRLGEVEQEPLAAGRDAERPERFLVDREEALWQPSLKLAGAVLSELGQINTLHKPHVERAGFAVLKAPDVPSILVETAFISNPQEEALLRSAKYQDKLVDALVGGVGRYFTKNPPRARQRVL